MDGRCATCRWWIPELGYLARYAAVQGWGNCQLVAATYRGEQLERGHPDSQALVICALHDYATLTTAPDFGCVQWEAKEA